MCGVHYPSDGQNPQCKTHVYVYCQNGHSEYVSEKDEDNHTYYNPAGACAESSERDGERAEYRGRSRFPHGQTVTDQTALLIKFDPFEPQHPEFPIAVRHNRTALNSRLVFLSTEPSDRSIRGDDSVTWNERSEGVICESGAD